MLKVRADILTFYLPESWDEITLGQALTIFAGVTPKTLILALTGNSEADLAQLRAPDLADILTTHLGFIADVPDFSSLPVPTSITIAGKTITPITNIGTQSTIAQKWDADEILSTYDLESLSLFNVGADLLAIYLYPDLTGKPYTDIALARAELPAILETPCTEMLPLAAFFLTSLLAPINSGRVSLSKVSKATPTPKWRQILRQVTQRLTPTLRFSS